MDSTLLFWDVDTQVDFIRPEGKLYVPGAEEIVPNLERLTRWAFSHKVPVIASADAHQPGDKEFDLYPPHCLAGTPGQEKIPETRLMKQGVIPNRTTELTEDLTTAQQIVLEKQQFDVFSNPNADAVLELLNPSRIVLYGVVTEICVAAAARGLLDRGHKISLVTDAIRHLDETGSRKLIEEVQHRGGRLLTTAQVESQRVA